MSRPLLIIGNRTYSSWSFRPWLALRQAGIDFDEQVSPFDEANHNAHFLAFSPVKQVPVLKHDGLTLWESLAIMEYAAERWPQARLWPDDMSKRAVARVAAHEMHAGFSALRRACPMNMRRKVARLAVSEAVKKDVSRIVAMWNDLLDDSGGPFLFGDFTIADAMYAPVVNRLHVYDLSDDKTARGYMNMMMALPTWREWEHAAGREPWVVEEEEV